MKRKTKKKLNLFKNTASNIFSLLLHTNFGKIIFFSLIVAGIVFLTIYGTANDFDRFFKVLGIELLIITVSGWILYLALKRI